MKNSSLNFKRIYMRKLQFAVFVLIAIFFTHCAPSEQATKESNDQNEVYVFDDADIDSSSVTSPPPPVVEEPVVFEKKTVIDSSVAERYFVVQVGAFTSEDRAKKFIAENNSKTEFNLSYRYSAKVNLYVVQLPPFTTRAEAEIVRDKMWTIKEFKDAFIVP